MQDGNSKAVILFLLIDIKAFFVCFVCDAVFNHFTEHHLAGAHVIEHDVLQRHLKSLLVDKEKVNLIICCYLKSYISFDVIDKASNFELFVEFPLFSIQVFVELHLEE